MYIFFCFGPFFESFASSLFAETWSLGLFLFKLKDEGSQASNLDIEN